MKLLLIISFELALAGFTTASALEKWIYLQTNLLVPEQVAFTESLLERGAKAGYDHLCIADSKFSRLAQMDRRYFDHVKQVRGTASRLHIEIVPCVFPVGYSNELLSGDPNLSEGLPVKDALFIVMNGEARAVTEEPTQLRNGNFADSAKRNGWNVLDDSVRLEEGAVHMKDPRGKNSRITQTLRLHPFRVYHLSLRVKSQNFSAMPEAKLLVNGRQLNYAYLGAKQNQDWTTHHVVFNSLENDSATLYLGAWGAESGELWWKDVALEEAGLVNLLRRPGCPFVVKMDDGKVLEEGRDFEPVRDPKLGMVPYAGSFDVWHEPPPIRTKLPDGTRLRVGFYHPMLIYDEQVCACPSEPRTNELLADQARRVAAAWEPGSFMMSHDEWRVMNWCDACMKRNLDAGAIAAQNARDCTGFLKAVSPASRIFVWNDMFDPHHNARNNYYLVRGDYAGSWEGLDKAVIIMNWNLGKLSESLKFFAARGHRQIIAGYYDGKVDKLREHLAAAKDVPGVIGVMYTTWKKRYEDIEAFARIADQP